LELRTPIIARYTCVRPLKALWSQSQACWQLVMTGGASSSDESQRDEGSSSSDLKIVYSYYEIFFLYETWNS